MEPELSANEIIARLELRPHPEGGYYRETFRDQRVDAKKMVGRRACRNDCDWASQQRRDSRVV